MATALTRDFLVKSGLVVQGTSDVTSSTNSTQTLQVNGGASIAKKLYVGSDANIFGNLTTYGTTTFGALTAGIFTATGIVTLTDATAATTAGAGALVVAGGGYFGKNLVIKDTAASTGTAASNALYVAGGVGVDGSLVVGGKTVFKDDVTFSGAATYVLSTNTVYTDNILELHTPPGGVSSSWTLDDGKDIGVRFHYFLNAADTSAALVLANDTKMLEWYSSGAEGANAFTGATYGGFKTGYIQLTSATAATSTITGALQLVGGIGLGGEVYAGGNVSAATLTSRGLTAGRVAIVTTGGQLTDDDGLVYDSTLNLLTTTVTNAITATNIANGVAGDIVYQSAAGATAFITRGSVGQILQSNGTTATFVSTGSIIVGAAAIAGRADGATNIINGAAGQLIYQSGVSATAFIPVGTTGYILQSNGSAAPTWVALSGVSAGSAITASNVASGFTYGIPFQSAPGVTTFDQNFKWDSVTATIKSVNAIFTGTSAASSTSTGALQVVGSVGVGGGMFVGGTVTATLFVGALTGVATTATNIAGGTVGQIPNQTAAGVTGFISTGSVGSLLQQGLSTAAFVTTGTIIVGKSVTAINLDLGAAGQIPMQTGAGATAYIAAGTAGQLLQSGGTTATFVNTSTLLVGYSVFANTATNIAAGTAGSIVYQSAVGVTGFVTIGANDTVLRSNGTVASFVATNTLNAGTANTATNIAGGTVGQIPVQTAAGATAFITAGTAGQILQSSGASATFVSTSTLHVSTATYAVTAGSAGATTLIAVTDNHATATPYYLVSVSATSGNLAATAVGTWGPTVTPSTGVVAINTNTVSGATNQGALTVLGGVGIGGNIYVGGTSNVAGVSYVTNASNATAVNGGALRVSGGVGVNNDVYVGGIVTAGATAAATSGTVVPAFFSNNTLIATYTSPTITTTAAQNLDVFAAATYRSAKYFVQVVDGGGTKVHVSEMSLFHDGTNVYLNEYGMAYSATGSLGSFDAVLAAGNVTLTFTPSLVTAMSIKVVRLSLTA